MFKLGPVKPLLCLEAFTEDQMVDKGGMMPWVGMPGWHSPLPVTETSPKLEGLRPVG